MSKRLARLNEQLKRELSELIRTRVRDPRVGLVTITGVDVAADLGSAKIYVREIGGSDPTETLAGLEAAAPFLRTTLGRTLRVRRIPELRFREDRSYLGAQRIEEMLSEVLPPGSEPPPEESIDHPEPPPEDGGAA
ncbi:MAG: 30S ribosome-binding factor RbfA [Gemmatimonadetes bacterium]|nr:30S ribosome-binding factor RbfA [Gemmatimonadota bacterium]MDA1103588.1 30S ribosome-binding factor RbfA [Gemmatimonadota bacterium]